MKTICIMNLKGRRREDRPPPINLAAVLPAQHGKRVLLIDADHQGNTSTFFGADQEGPTLREVLLGEAEPCWAGERPADGVRKSGHPPASMFSRWSWTPRLNLSTQCLWRLREFLLAVAGGRYLRFCHIDMPPAFSLRPGRRWWRADEVTIGPIVKLDASPSTALASSCGRLPPCGR